MARDRLNEFQNAAARRPPTQISDGGFGFGGQMEMGQMPPVVAPPTYGGGANNRADNRASEAFFDKLAEVRDIIKGISSSIRDIENAHQEHFDARTESEARRYEQEVDDLVTDTTRTSNVARTKIKELNELIRKMTPDEAEPARTQLRSVKEAFMTTMTRFQDVERTYRKKLRERIERQIKIVKPDATSDELDNMISSDQGAQVFAQSVLQSNPYGHAQQALREVQERHEDIRKIEKTILELHALFQDMAMLVEAQSETVQQIATQVEQAEHFTEAATKEVGEAIEIRKKTRKKLWFLCILGVVLVLIIAIILFVQFGGSLGGGGEEAPAEPQPTPGDQNQTPPPQDSNPGQAPGNIVQQLQLLQEQAQLS